MRIQVIVVLVLAVFGTAAWAFPTMYSAEGVPEQGQEFTVEASGLSPQGTLRMFIANSPKFTHATQSVEQTITFHGGGSGPVRFQANFSGFNDGDLVYIIPANGDPNTAAAPFGKPLIVGHPMVYSVVMKGGFSHTAQLMGIGYGPQTGQAGVFIGDDPVWANCSVTVAQAVRSWGGKQIEFDVVYGSLDTGALGYVFVRDADGDLSVRGDEIALSHPVVGSVTVDGNTLTTTGLGFKDRGGETVVFDDFERGNHNTKLSLGPGSTWHDYHGGGVYSNEHPYGGGMSASTLDTIGEVFDTNYHLIPPSDKVFVSYQLAYVYRGDLSQIGTIWKPTRINTNADRAGFYNGEGCYSMGQATSPGDGWPRGFWTAVTAWDALSGWRRLGDVPQPDGTYHRMELYRDLASAGTMDGFNYWRSGTSTSTDYAAPGRGPGTSYLQTSTILGLMGSNVTAPLRIYIDDFYCATTLARVVIADNPVYENATKVAIQPVSSWSDGNIVADLNLAGLESSPERYVIVIDQHGDASLGLSLSGGQLGLPGQPGRPGRIP